MVRARHWCHTSHTLCPVYFSFLTLNFPFSWSFPDVLPEDSDGEGGGGAEAETVEVRAEPPGQPDQRAGPPQENGGEVLLTGYPTVIVT